MGVYIGGTKVAGLEKELPAQAGNAGKYLYTDGENASWQEAATTQIWIGTQAEYEALGVYDPEVVYEITDDCANLEPIQHSVTERNIGEIVYSTVPITDPCVHLADGDLLDGTGIYKDFYEYMVSVYDAGHTSIFTTEEDWQNQYTNNNHICGKYVLNTTNHTIRLPSIWGWLEGVRDELKAGTYVPPGLPNITGTAGGYIPTGYAGYSGAFTSNTTTQGSSHVFTPDASDWNRIGFDASLSSSVYGTQTTDAVQPRGVQVLIYIVIANTVKTPVQIEMDEIVNDLNKKANVSLNNSTAITNCITEIPQDIKLELSSGTLTLKAGSRVYVPNGAGIFNTVTVSSDVIITPTGGSGQCMISVNDTATAGNATGISGCVSGANPTIPDYGLGYNTTTNIIQRTGGSGSVVIAKSSFPLAIVTQTNGVITSIDQVFNGIGYIGTAWFMLPGIKGLAPNGFNPDGTHKNISFTNPSVYVYTVAATTARSIGVQINTSGIITDVINTKPSNINYGLTKNKPTTIEDDLGHWYYSTDENQWYYTTGSTTASWHKAYPVFGGQRTGTSTTTTDFAIKQTFSPLDINEFQVLLGIMYPIGAVYIGTQNACPMVQLMPGTTWELVSSGKALWTGTGSNANTTIAAGLPAHEHAQRAYIDNLGIRTLAADTTTGGGAKSLVAGSSITSGKNALYTNGVSNSIYGASTTVQPPAYVVNVWRRTV